MSHSETQSEAEHTSQALKGQVDDLQKFNDNIKEKLSYIELLKEKCNKKEQNIAEKESKVEKLKQRVYKDMKDFSTTLPSCRNEIEQDFNDLATELDALNVHGEELTQHEKQIENELNQIKSYLRQFGGEIGNIRNSLLAIDENDTFIDSIDFSTMDLKQAYNLICDISSEISEHEKLVINSDLELTKLRVQHMKILENLSQHNVEISNENSKHYLYINDNNTKKKQVNEFSKSAQSLKETLEKEVKSQQEINKPIICKLEHIKNELNQTKAELNSVIHKQNEKQQLITSIQNETNEFETKKIHKEEENRKEVEIVLNKYRQLQKKKEDLDNKKEEVQQYIRSLDEVIEQNHQRLQKFEEKVLQEERDVRILELALKKEESNQKKQIENKTAQMTKLIEELNNLLEERTIKLSELNELEQNEKKTTNEITIPQISYDSTSLEKTDRIVRESYLLKEQINVTRQRIIQLRALNRATKGEINRIHTIITSDQQTHIENQNNNARILSNIESHHESELSRLKRSILILSLQNDERRSSISKKQDVLEKISTEYNIIEYPNGLISVTRKERPGYISSYNTENFMKIIDHLNVFYKDVSHALSKLQIATVSSVQKAVINKWLDALSNYDELKLPIIG